jgi:hypothetical protein
MGRDGIEIQIETIAGEKGEAARDQVVSQGVNDAMRGILRARAKMEDGKKLRTGVDRQPEPQHMLRAAQPRAQFIQLDVWDLEGVEAALMEDLRVSACTSEPRRDGGLSVAKDPFSSGRVQPFGQRREHDCDLLRRGFQTVQGRVPSGTERDEARLAAKGLDTLGTAMLSISDQRMDMSVCDPSIGARFVGAS